MATRSFPEQQTSLLTAVMWTTDKEVQVQPDRLLNLDYCGFKKIATMQAKMPKSKQ
jgi:hypothetical protein